MLKYLILNRNMFFKFYMDTLLLPHYFIYFLNLVYFSSNLTVGYSFYIGLNYSIICEAYRLRHSFNFNFNSSCP